MSDDKYRNPFESVPPEKPDKPVHPLLVQRQTAEAGQPSVAQQPPQQRPVMQPRVSVPTSKPYLTYTLLGINIVIFLIDMLLGNRLIAMGAKLNPAIIDGEWWRFITPMFLHAGLLHLGFNSYFLYIVGPQIEGAFGTLRFALVYFIAGLAGSLGSYALAGNPAIPSIGASGALFGILGAAIPFLLLNRDVLPGTSRRLRSILQIIGLNLFIGFLPGLNIDNWGHIGGLLGGLAVAFFVSPRYIKKASMEKNPLVEDSHYIAYHVEDETQAVGAFVAAMAIAFAIAALAAFLVSIEFNAF